MIILCLSKIINIYFKILFQIVVFLTQINVRKDSAIFLSHNTTLILFSDHKQRRTKRHNVKTDDTEANETK